jgi:hypothetical protein
MRPFDQFDLSHVIDKSIKWFKLHRFLSGGYLLIVLRISHRTSRMSFRMCAHRIPAGAKVVKIDRIATRIVSELRLRRRTVHVDMFFSCFCCKKIWKNHQKWVLEGLNNHTWYHDLPTKNWWAIASGATFCWFGWYPSLNGTSQSFRQYLATRDELWFSSWLNYQTI